MNWELHCPDGFDGPSEISSWVVRGRLAMGYYPGRLRGGKAAPKVLDELLDNGIDQFINLTQDRKGGTDEHLVPCYYRLSDDPDGRPLVRVGRREGTPINVALHPVPDEHLPGCDLEGMAARSSCGIDGYGEDLVSCEQGRPVQATRRILDAIDTYLEQDRMVYVHCWGGSGRTGTVVGCWIRRHGLADQDEVLDCLQNLREGDSVKHGKSIPNVSAQMELIMNWEEGW